MIFLLNREYVVWEAVELARLQMCEVLQVTPDAIEAKVDLAGEALSPEFNVDADQCEGVRPDEIREVMRHVYADCKEEMEYRLKGIVQTRENVQQWLHGGMTEEEYAAVRDPAVEPNMVDALAPVIPLAKRRGRMVKARWRLRDAFRWLKLIWVGVRRRLAFWR